MAEPATQSPYISSSAGGGSLEPAGRDLKGAGSPQSSAGDPKGTNEKPMLSNAQKEHLDAQRQDHVSDGTSEDSGVGPADFKEVLLSTGSKGPERKADSSGHHDIPKSVFLSGNPDPFAWDQLQTTVSSAHSKSASLSDLKVEPAQAPTRDSHLRPPTSPGVAAETSVEKDSPESPFEVIADKLEFDKEFKEILSSNTGDVGNGWPVHGPRELLTDIPEDSVCEFPSKPRGGTRIPSGPALTRQSSGTTAALEEVSKCVREMHSFTSELLHWDLIPKDLSDDSAGSAFLASPTESSNRGVAKSGVGKVEVGKTCSSHQPLTISLHQKNKPALDVEGKPTVVGQKVSPEKTAPATAVSLKADVRWPSSSLPEVMDADSSGESDDTVIEDITAIPVSKNGRAVDSNKVGVPAKPDEPTKAEMVHVDSKGMPGESHKPNQGSRISPSTLECSWGTMDDLEALQTKAGIRGENTTGPPLPSETSIPDLPTKARQERGNHEQDLFGKRPKMEGLPLSSTKDALRGESFVDFMKECMNSKGSESPEDPVETFSEAELKAARSHGMVSSFQPSPTLAQDFEQEHVTIKALKDVGRKSETERPIRVTVAGGRRPLQPCDLSPDPPAPAQKSALEKRPLCLEQAVDMKLVSAPTAFAPSKATQAPPAKSAAAHAVAKWLAGFSVRDLIFWRDVKKTGLVFSTTLILLLSLAAFSVISVVSYLILALLSVTISFRVYKSVIQAVQKSEEGHPFKAYLDLDVALSSEAFHSYVSTAMVHVNHALKLTMRLFLVEDLVDSLKLAVVMWLMTYIGAIFNGITVLILAELLTFSIPVVYEKYKTQIDHYVGIVRDQTKMVVTKIQAKLPGAVKKKAE